MGGGLARAALTSLACVALAGAAAVPAAAQISGYDGKNPFDCELQQAGQGTKFPHPHADPFCVEYDKTQQNVTQLGVLIFLSKEPERFGAAGDKCWYFQHDHWTGSIVQGQAPQTYHWDGSYFFDRAKGTGGAYVENFTVDGQTGDPRDLPGFPAEYRPYFGPGRGGSQFDHYVDIDPNCVAKAKQKSPYRKTGGSGGKGGKPGSRSSYCAPRTGSVGSGIAGMRLGMTKDDVRKARGSPHHKKNGFYKYCVKRGGRLMAGFPSGRSARVEFVFVSAPDYHVGDVKRGTSESAARKELRGEYEIGRPNGTILLGVRSRSRVLVVAIRKGRVIALAVGAAGLNSGKLMGYYERTR
jgi:hypothetical protein